MTRILASGVVALLVAAGAPARGAVVYDSIPNTIAPNVDSLVYGDASAAEFGDAIQLGGSGRALTSVTILLSSGAVRSQYAGAGTASGFIAPLTLMLYTVASTGADPAPGAVIATREVDALVPWRPAASTACTGGDYQAADGFCYSALAFPVTFDLTGTTVPSSLIFGLSFNTESSGTPPTGVAGPIDQLGFGFSPRTTVGTDLDPDGVEWNTSDASFRSIGPANVFGPDTGWASVGIPAAEFVVADAAAVPEPETWLLLAATIGITLGLRQARRSVGVAPRISG